MEIMSPKPAINIELTKFINKTYVNPFANERFYKKNPN